MFTWNPCNTQYEDKATTDATCCFIFGTNTTIINLRHLLSRSRRRKTEWFPSHGNRTLSMWRDNQYQFPPVVLPFVIQGQAGNKNKRPGLQSGLRRGICQTCSTTGHYSPYYKLIFKQDATIVLNYEQFDVEDKPLVPCTKYKQEIRLVNVDEESRIMALTKRAEKQELRCF